MCTLLFATVSNHRTDFTQIVLFSKHFNTPGIHEIIIRNENDTRVIPGGNSQLTIDRIVLEIAADDTSIATPSSSSVSTLSISGSSLLYPSQSTSVSVSASSLVAGASLVASISASVSASSSPSDSQAISPHPSPIGSIVGGALGGGVVVVLICLFLFWNRLRRRRKASTANTGASSSAGPVHPSSLPPSTTVAPPMAMAHNSTTLLTRFVQYPARYGYALRPGKGAQDYFLPSSMSSHLEPSSSHPPPPPSSSRGRWEQAAGPLPVGTEEPTLPPEYNQVFLHPA